MDEHKAHEMKKQQAMSAGVGGRGAIMKEACRSPERAAKRKKSGSKEEKRLGPKLEEGKCEVETGNQFANDVASL